MPGAFALPRAADEDGARMRLTLPHDEDIESLCQ